MGADVVAIAHKERYLRGRTVEELDALLREGAARVGVDRRDVVRHRGGVPAALVAEAEPGDVVGLMCHEERQGVYDWLAAEGFTADTPETLRAKVIEAQG